jgi:hypothetical protein
MEWLAAPKGMRPEALPQRLPVAANRTTRRDVAAHPDLVGAAAAPSRSCPCTWTARSFPSREAGVTGADGQRHAEPFALSCVEMDMFQLGLMKSRRRGCVGMAQWRLRLLIVRQPVAR